MCLLLATIVARQGAAMSLRILAEGVAALIYANVFSAGSSVGFEEAPFFVASAISVLTLAVSVAGMGSACLMLYVVLGSLSCQCWVEGLNIQRVSRCGFLGG